MQPKRIVLIYFMVVTTFLLQAQSAKKVKEYKITTKQTIEIEVERGTKARTIEEFEAFNADGNIIEYRDYNSDGKLKSWIKYEYNADEEIIKEVYLNEKGNLIESIEYIFKDGLKTEKLYFDSKHRLVKKKVYEYTFK